MTPSVAEFYRGKNILITGATGFIGKPLIEKLLRSFSDIGTIYLLLREKKGVSEEERLKTLCSNEVYDFLHKTQPDVFKKLKLVAGDMLEDELGLSHDDLQELKRNCNIVFHSAACVRFDQKLKDAVNTNIRGTLQLLKLAETMENLKVFVHLSTAYCRSDLESLDEKLYDPAHDPEKIIDLVNWLDDELLDHFESKLISPQPNTYSYTKALTENLVAQFSSKFPIAIGRPSIITASWKEPMPGWIDNINGPTGLMVGCAKGVIRSALCEPSYIADCIPVDVIVNSCILIAYTTALDKSKDVSFFNLSLCDVQNFTWKEIIEKCVESIREYPLEVALWYPSFWTRTNWIAHKLDVIFTHLLPAYLVDMVLFLLRKKPFLINLHKRMNSGFKVLVFYATKEWKLKNENFLSLQKRISKTENDTFYTDLSKLNKYDYLRNYIIGTRIYICKEDLSNLPRAIKLHKIRYWVDVIMKLMLLALLSWFLFSKCDILNFISSVHNSLSNLISSH